MFAMSVSVESNFPSDLVSEALLGGSAAHGSERLCGDVGRFGGGGDVASKYVVWA